MIQLNHELVFKTSKIETISTSLSVSSKERKKEDRKLKSLLINELKYVGNYIAIFALLFQQNFSVKTVDVNLRTF